MVQVKEAIREADMVLVGLGEEFDDIRSFRGDAGYRAGKVLLADSEKYFLLPAWQRLFRESEEHREAQERLVRGLQLLAQVLEGKNYFVVSVSSNGRISDIPWREGRLVTPCGSDLNMQCSAGCSCGVRPLADEERAGLQEELRRWRQSILEGRETGLPRGLGICRECGGERELNNIYNSHYNEQGYQADWQNYTKWLQGTLKHRLAVLELGVGMQFPSVIRWPFEKVAFLNRQAHIYRVNENLYQLTEEIAEKGTAIAENAIDWLQNLC